jgi:hypothetical protein
MTNEKWEQLIEVAKKNFKDVELSSEDLIMETPEGPQKQGTQDVLIFDLPQGGRYKLVRENKPIVIEKKEMYSHRAGQSAQAQYKFSETEFSHRLRVYKEIDFDDWEEVTLDSLGL